MTSLLPPNASKELRNRLIKLFLAGKRLSKRQVLFEERLLGTVPRDPIRIRIALDMISGMYTSLKKWFPDHDGRHFGIVDEEDMDVSTKKVYVKAKNGTAGHWEDVETERRHCRYGLLKNGDELVFRLNKSYYGLAKGIMKNAQAK